MNERLLKASISVLRILLNSGRSLLPLKFQSRSLFLLVSMESVTAGADKTSALFHWEPVPLAAISPLALELNLTFLAMLLS